MICLRCKQEIDANLFEIHGLPFHEVCWKNEGNMYSDSLYQWNCFKGCRFQCSYCVPSFQRQAKRHKVRCYQCYTYHPHLHAERLDSVYVDKHFPDETPGDTFVWAASSGDVSFAWEKDMNQILDVIEDHGHLTFFMQSKNPACFQNHFLPKNLIIGTTMETNRTYSKKISTAPAPKERWKALKDVEHPRKSVTIEPIMKFDRAPFVAMLEDLAPERVYIGYNSKPKEVRLPEPSLRRTARLIKDLQTFTKVKPKLLRNVPEFKEITSFGGAS